MIVFYFLPYQLVCVWGILTVGSQYVLILNLNYQLILLLKVISIFGIYLQLF